MPFVQNTVPMMPNSSFVAGNMNGMNVAFGNMSMGQTQQAAPSQGGGDDDFGDFAAAPQSFSMGAPSIRADPLSKLVSLDGLSKNPNNNKQREWSTCEMGPLCLVLCISLTTSASLIQTIFSRQAKQWTSHGFWHGCYEQHSDSE